MLKAGLYDDLITQTLRDEISRMQECVVSRLRRAWDHGIIQKSLTP